MDVWIVDRFEGAFAVCEADDLETLKIPRAALPQGVTEGSVLRGLPDGSLQLDGPETKKRREALFLLQSQTFE
jgi:hypothetical protein